MPLTLENPNQGAILSSEALAEQAKLQQQQNMQQLQLQIERSHLQLTQLQ